MAVIQFSPTGEVAFTRKPELLALFKGENKSVERMSEILFDETTQLYYVKLGFHPYHGRFLSHQLTEKFGAHIRRSDFPTPEHVFSFRLLFSTYEKAVAAEVAFIDGVRRSGLTISVK